MLSFGMLGARFVYYYGAGAHVDYDPKLVGLGGTQPYVTIKPADAQERERMKCMRISAAQYRLMLYSLDTGAVRSVVNTNHKLNQSYIWLCRSRIQKNI